MQELVDQLELGQVPRSITVVLMRDLVDQCKPGDQVIVTYESSSIGVYVLCGADDN